MEFKFNEEGKIIPDAEAVRRMDKKYPDRSAAEKWLLAQADTLLRYWQAEGKTAVDTVISFLETGALDNPDDEERTALERLRQLLNERQRSIAGVQAIVRD